jgi:hypothetical protein
MDDRKYMSRKFGMACFVLLSAIPLLTLNYITAGDYVNLNSITLGLYFTGSVAADYVAKK